MTANSKNDSVQNLPFEEAFLRLCTKRDTVYDYQNLLFHQFYQEALATAKEGNEIVSRLLVMDAMEARNAHDRELAQEIETALAAAPSANGQTAMKLTHSIPQVVQ